MFRHGRLASSLRDRLYQDRSGDEGYGGDSPVKPSEYAATAPMTISVPTATATPTATDLARSVAGIVLTALGLEDFVLFPASTCPRGRHQQMCAGTGFLQRLRSSAQRRTLGVGTFRGCHPRSTHAYDVLSDRNGRPSCETRAARKRPREGGGATSRQMMVVSGKCRRVPTVERARWAPRRVTPPEPIPPETDLVKRRSLGQARNFNASLRILQEAVSLGQRAPIREELFSVERLEAHATQSRGRADRSFAGDPRPAAGRPTGRQWRGPAVGLSSDREGDRRWARDHAGGGVADRQLSFGRKADPSDQHGFAAGLLSPAAESSSRAHSPVIRACSAWRGRLSPTPTAVSTPTSSFPSSTLIRRSSR